MTKSNLPINFIFSVTFTIQIDYLLAQTHSFNILIKYYYPFLIVISINRILHPKVFGIIKKVISEHIFFLEFFIKKTFKLSLLERSLESLLFADWLLEL